VEQIPRSIERIPSLFSIVTVHCRRLRLVNSYVTTVCIVIILLINFQNLYNERGNDTACIS